MYRPTIAVAAALLLPLHAQDPILQRIPKGSPVFVVVRDLMPTLETAVASPQLRRVAERFAALAKDLTATKLDPAALDRLLPLVRNFVPSEAGLSLGPGALESLLRTIQIAAAAKLLPMGKELDDDELRERLTDLAGDAAKNLQPLQATAFVTMRDERTVDLWFEQIQDLVEKSGAAFAWLQPKVAVEGDRITMAVRPFADANGPGVAWLRRAGLDPAPLAAFELKAVLEQQGKTLRIQLGEPGKDAMPAESLGALWRPGPQQLAFGTWSLGDAKETLHATWDLLTDLDLDAMDATAQVAVGQGIQVLERMLGAGEPAVAALEVDSGLVLTVDMPVEGDDDLDPPCAEVLRCASRDDGPFLLSALPLDAELSSLRMTMDDIVGRALRSVASSGGDLDGMLAATGALTKALEPLFDFLDGEDSAVFAPGTAIVTRPTRLKSLTLSAMGDSLDLTDLPFFGAAIVARADTADAGTQFVDTCVEHLAKAAGGDARKALVEKDLGFGGKTRTLAWENWLPEEFELSIEGGFQPHVVQKGTLLVISTDPALTKLLLARAESKDAANAPFDDLLGWTQLRGEHLGALVGGLGTWLQQVPEMEQQPLDVLTALATIGPLLGTFERREQLLHGVYRTVNSWRAAPTTAATGK